MVNYFHGKLLSNSSNKIAMDFLTDLISKKLDDKKNSSILKEVLQVVKEAKTSNTISSSKDKLFNLTQQEWDWMARHNSCHWVDYLIYRYKFKVYPQKQLLEDFPQYLLIEPTSVCNLKCIMCFQSDKTFKDRGFINLDFFKNLVDQARDAGCRAITLSSRGEPLLHKEIDKMLSYLYESKILDVKINTNATLLSEKLSHALLSAEISELVFSVDAITEETYNKIRRGGKFSKVLENIKMFNKIKEKYYPKSPTITRVSSALVGGDQNEKKIANFWLNLVDEVTLKTILPRWDAYNNSKFELKEPCVQLWRQMYVWYDGTVNPCDFDYKSYLKLGNAKEESLKKIWKGENFNKLRNDHLSGLRSKNNPCDRCPLV